MTIDAGAPLTLKPLPSLDPVSGVQTSDSDPDSDPPPPESVVGFSKQLYAALATQNSTALAEHFRPAFDSLNQDNRLGDTLSILYDMRLMDLQASIRHARKMKEVIDILAE